MPNGKMIGILRRFENDVYFICKLEQRIPFIFPLPCVMLSPPGELNFAVYTTIMQLRNNLSKILFVPFLF